jgi:hypothetical protein
MPYPASRGLTPAWYGRRNPPGVAAACPGIWRGTQNAAEEDTMATVRIDPHALPDPKDERVIRRIMRLTLYTLTGVLLALAALVLLA